MPCQHQLLLWNEENASPIHPTISKKAQQINPRNTQFWRQVISTFSHRYLKKIKISIHASLDFSAITKGREIIQRVFFWCPKFKWLELRKGEDDLSFENVEPSNKLEVAKYTFLSKSYRVTYFTLKTWRQCWDRTFEDILRSSSEGLIFSTALHV